MGVNQPFQLYSCPNFLLLLLWLQFLSNNIPGLVVVLKVLAYKYIKVNDEMFEHNIRWRQLTLGPFNKEMTLIGSSLNVVNIDLSLSLMLELRHPPIICPPTRRWQSNQSWSVCIFRSAGTLAGALSWSLPFLVSSFSSGVSKH